MKYLSGLLLLLASAQLSAEIISVKASGQGVNLETAIDAALVRAVEQVSGVSIDANKTSIKSLTRDNEGTEFNSASVNGLQKQAAGKIKSYQVMSEQCDDQGCQVQVIAKIERSHHELRQEKMKQQNKNRRTIAVANFSGSKGKQLSTELEGLLVKDRKFSVLNDTGSANLDYIIEGKMLTAATHKKVVDKSRTVELTGEYIKDVKTYYSSKVVVEFKVIDLVNDQVKWSDTITTTSSRANLSYLLELTAKKAFDQLKSNIYPLVIIKGDDNSIMLNSGGDTVKEGEIYDVFSAGQTIIDPTTGESLGAVERKIGQIKVTSVLPKLSYATLIKGDIDAVATKQIARKAKAATVKRKSRKASKPKPKAEPESPGIVL